MASTWQERGLKKRESTLAKIPAEWRLPEPIPSAEAQKDVTGPYVQQFLSAQEIEITESDAVKITENTTTGKWTATEVVTAFCHRAALAHQLVSICGIAAPHDAPLLIRGFYFHRLIACTKYSSIRPSNMRKILTRHSPLAMAPPAHSMDSP